MSQKPSLSPNMHSAQQKDAALYPDLGADGELSADDITRLRKDIGELSIPSEVTIAGKY